MSKVSRVRKADCVASHVQCPLEVSATARCRTMMLDAGLRSLHVVTLIRAPCGTVHHSQVSYGCSAGERSTEEKKGDDVVVLRREETGDEEGFYT